MGVFYEWLGEELSLFVRQQAWLATAPDRDKHEKTDPEPRIKAMAARGEHIPIPPNPARYLTDWLFEIGPSVPGGMAPAPIGWRDITAWQDLTGVELLPWEARVLRRLSRDFVTASREARERNCPMPWSGIETTDDVAARRADVTAKLRAALGSFKAKD